jgi:DNA-binding GntR family transcriptional regulator
MMGGPTPAGHLGDFAEAALPPATMTIAQRASRLIRGLIWEGHLRAGDRIPQARIAAQLGVSSIPVREALIALEREGFITSHPNRGAFVAPWTHRSIEDHSVLVAMLRGLAVELATDRASSEELGRLGAISAAVSDAIEPTELDAIMAGFVDRVIRLTQSVTVSSTLRNLVSVIPGSFFTEVVGAMAFVQRETPEIIRLMQLRQGAEARRLTDRMFVELGRMVVATLEQRGLLPATQSI